MKYLPKSPNLDYLKKQAKQLHKSFLTGNKANDIVDICLRLRHYDTSFSKKSDGDIFNSKFTLTDAQRIIAREYGFSSWAKLKHFVEAEKSVFNQILSEKLQQLCRDEEVMYDRLVTVMGGHEYAEELQQLHIHNSQEFEAIVDHYGWPGTSLVGVVGGRASWKLAQYSINNPAFQLRCLDLLKEAAEKGEAPIRQVALLTDRIRYNMQQPQLYGLIQDWDESGKLSCGELEEPDKVDQRRANMGLPPLAEELEKNDQALKEDVLKPPKDWKLYKQKAHEWAKKTGWI